MAILVRLEEEGDYKAVEHLTREAFWDLYKPGCDEHLLVHKLRKVPAFVKELSLVALDNGQIVGNIMYSKAKIVNEVHQEFEVLCMGPIGVLPAYQGKGIGAALMDRSIEKARALGFKAVVIFGNPGYYHRFGYRNAAEYGIQTSSGENFDPFMVLELFSGALEGISGKFYEDQVFKIDEAELEMFEKEFPYKEKHITDTQLF